MTGTNAFFYYTKLWTEPPSAWLSAGLLLIFPVKAAMFSKFAFLEKKSPLFFVFLALIISAVVVFIANMHIWSLLPIYSDEISYRFFSTRALLDDWKRIALFPTCVSTNYLPIPLIFYPASFVLSAYALFEDMQLYRYFGIAVFIGTCIFAGLTLSRLVGNKKLVLIVASALTLMALFVGVLPSLLVMLRPEHLIYLSVIFSCWVIMRKSATPPYLALFFMLLFYSMAIYQHPKEVYFAPGIAFIIIVAARRWLALQGAALALLVAITVCGISFGLAQFLHCPESPTLEGSISYQNISPLEAVKSPETFIKDVYTLTTTRSWAGIFKKMTFQDMYDGGGSTGYLPGIDKQAPAVKTANAWVYLSVYLILIFSVVFFILNIRAVCAELRKREQSLAQTLLSTEHAAFPLLLILFYIAVFTHLFLNRNQVFYDVGCWFILFTFLNCFTLVYLSSRNQGGISPRILHFCIMPLMGIHLVSALLSVNINYSYTYKAFVDKTPVLGVMVKDYDRAAMQAKVQDALLQCHLTDEAPALVHDDYTYPYIQKSHNPLSVSWVFADKQNENAALEFLGSVDASGIVMRCGSLRSAFHFPENKIGMSGDVCCVRLMDHNGKK
ncbi:MAG: hypothetical protein EB059_02380 [Alphaproteobacteria bacterium]|nr:hypothetical protein [Alphaproteobacteria bacterium]